jgi:hypothetical protein
MNAQASRDRRKGDLVRSEEIRRVVEELRALGISIGAVDVRRDGVTVYPAAPQPGNAFDQWQEQDQNRDRPARRS